MDTKKTFSFNIDCHNIFEFNPAMAWFQDWETVSASLKLSASRHSAIAWITWWADFSI